MIEKILQFMEQAGRIAMSHYGSARRDSFKSEETCDIVTEADTEINDRFIEFVDANFGDLNRVVVGEESVGLLGDDRFKAIDSSEWQFVVDPIDGTLTYALGIPMFGVSVGVLRRGRPYMGAVYLPALGELAYFDGRRAWWVRGAFTPSAVKEELKPSDKTGLATLILNMDWFVRVGGKLDFKRELPSNFYSAVVHMLYLATCRARGFYFGVYIWDLAGAWALLEYLGFGAFDFATGKRLDKFGPDEFNEKLKIKSCHVICRPAELKRLQEIAEPIDQE